jgi:hypothetical protein
VAEGQAAGVAWESLVGGGLSEAEREKTRKSLRQINTIIYEFCEKLLR